MPTPAETARAYHQVTKHHPMRQARSLGYMDWDSQPDPFRRYAGAAEVELGFGAGADPVARVLRLALGLTAWKEYEGNRWALRANPSSGNLHPTEGYVVLPAGRRGLPAGVLHYAPKEHALELRCSLGRGAAEALGERLPEGGFLVALTSVLWREAWKYGERALRYCALDTGHALAAVDYAAACEGLRAVAVPGWSDAQLGALLGVDREGDFAELDPWEHEHPELLLAVVPEGTSGAGFGAMAQGSGAERTSTAASQNERPGETDEPPAATGGEEEQGRDWKAVAAALTPDAVLGLFAEGTWHGTPNALSTEHHEWDVIHATAAATKRTAAQADQHLQAWSSRHGNQNEITSAAHVSRAQAEPDPVASDRPALPAFTPLAPNRLATLVRERRSAVSMVPGPDLALDAFARMLDATLLRHDRAPWRGWSEPSRAHLLLFVHRVEGLERGLYLLERHAGDHDELREAMASELDWRACDELAQVSKVGSARSGEATREAAGEAPDEAPGSAPSDAQSSAHGKAPGDFTHLRLFRLRTGHCEGVARSASCQQDIAADGAFSLGMLTRLGPVVERDPSAYRRLFWECGAIGQALYIEAEAAGQNATGIGCYFDDSVHALVGLTGDTWQVMYHFTVGVASEDARLRTLPPYAHLEGRSE